jgi:dihydroorotase
LLGTRRALDLATRHDHRFHVLHVSTADELPLIRAARGVVTAEACLHHLFFNTDDYARLGSRIQMNPSIKSKQDNDALFAALLDGTLQLVATDHAPHTLDEKAKPYPDSPSGLPAIENSLSLMLDQVARGRCTLEQVVDWMCLAPAQTWDILNKARIEPGYDADLVLVDLGLEHTIRDEEQLTKTRWSPWHGATLTGKPVRTIVRGRTVYTYDRETGEQHVDTALRGAPLAYDHALGGYWAHRSI